MALMLAKRTHAPRSENQRVGGLCVPTFAIGCTACLALESNERSARAEVSSPVEFAVTSEQGETLFGIASQIAGRITKQIIKPHAASANGITSSNRVIQQ